jgi:hypothetical protein
MGVNNPKIRWILAPVAALSLVVAVLGLSIARSQGPIDEPSQTNVPDEETVKKYLALDELPEEVRERYSSRPEFGGEYVETANGSVALVVLTTGDVSEMEALVAPGVAPDRKIVVRKVEYRWSDLEALRDEIIGSVDVWKQAGIRINTIGANPLHNRVVIGISPKTDSAVKRLEEAYGPRVVIVEQAEFSALD